MKDLFETNMRIIAGENLEKNQEKQLSDIDKKKITDAYFKLFFNLTYTNWLRGKTLGEAWYASLAQLEQYVNNKKGVNSASLYLKQIFAAHKTKWSQVMMTNKHRDDVLQATPEQKQKWTQETAKNTTSALNTLNETIKEFAQTQDKAQTMQNNSYQVAAEKMRMLIMMRIQQRNRQSGMAA